MSEVQSQRDVVPSPPAEQSALGSPKTSRRGFNGSVALKRVLGVACLAAAVCVPYLVGAYGLSIATVIVLAIPGAVALNLVTGVAGQASAGNPAFLAVGGMVAAFVLRTWSGAPALLVILAAGVVSAVIGVPVGLAAMRLKGLYLLISTFALFYIVTYALYVYQIHTVSATGFLIPPLTIFGKLIITPNDWYFTLLIVALISLIVMANILRTSVGRAWVAVRDADIAAEILGINVVRAKVDAFVLSSFIIGAQGAFFAYYFGVVQSDTYTFDIAIQYIAMIIIGGLGLTLGAVLGAIVVIGLPYGIQSLANHVPTSAPGSTLLQNHIFDIQNLLYGLLIILFVQFAPRGLADIVDRAFRWRVHRERV